MPAKKQAPKRAASSKASSEATTPVERKPRHVCPPRWKKGESGNPSGKARKLTSQVSQAIKHTLAMVAPGQKKRYFEAIGELTVRCLLKKQQNDFKKGEISRECIALLDLILDRSEGKVPTPITFPELAKTLDGKSAEELEHFAIYGVFPSQPEPTQ